MTEPQPPVRIHILSPEDEDDADLTDVGLVNIRGERHLFLKPQSFDSAVRQVSSAMPDLPMEHVERLLREHCADFKDFDELLGSIESVPPMDIRPRPGGPVQPARLHGRAKRWAIAAALVPALAASWAVGRYVPVGNEATQETKASVPDTATGTADTGVDTAPFVGEQFEHFAGSSKIECDPISSLEAECTDADGMVMSTKAATGPDSTIFTFSYGAERIGLRIFYDADYAKTWARQDGSKELYPHMKVHGRYVLWGTDPKRIQEYLDLLEQADRDARPAAMGGVAPLPPRLAALTLGTLGLDSQQVNQIMARPVAEMTDAPVMMAARLVLGLDMTPVWPGHGGDDIVALAAGIEPHPPTSVGGGTVVVGPVTEPATGTGSDTTTPTIPPTDSGSGSTTSPTAPTTTPPTDTTTPTVPATPKDATPTETTPTPAEPTPTDPATTEPPVDETPTTPVEETPAPPVEETPTPPVEETPAPPVEEPPTAPVEDTPAPVETPAEGATHPGQDTTPPVDTGDQDDAGDDLLILDSAWTVAA